jgi:hypothetical protein
VGFRSKQVVVYPLAKARKQDIDRKQGCLDS